MKDTKFIILLILIVLLFTINLVWLARLESDNHRLEHAFASYKPINVPIDINETSAFPKQLTLNCLNIVNEKGECLIELWAFGKQARINLLDLDPDNDFRVSLFSQGPRLEAGLEIAQPLISESPWCKFPQIRLSTSLVDCELNMVNDAGSQTKITPGIIKKFPYGSYPSVPSRRIK